MAMPMQAQNVTNDEVVEAQDDTEVDNFDKHIQDTMIAGDYISDYNAGKTVATMQTGT